jgi:hypothetical protein
MTVDLAKHYEPPPITDYGKHLAHAVDREGRHLEAELRTRIRLHACLILMGFAGAYALTFIPMNGTALHLMPLAPGIPSIAQEILDWLLKL